MVIQHQFGCAQEGCKAFVWIEIHCHDSHKFDIDKVGIALGFRTETIRDGVMYFQPSWYCEEHAHDS